MTRDRENPGRARAPCRDRSRDASLLFFGGVKHHGRARLARRRLDARAPCPCRLARKFAGLARSLAAGRPRGPIRRARGRDTCHDHYPTLRWRLVFSSPFLIGRGRARRATRLRPPKRGSRVAAGSRASAARSHAAPLIATPSLTDPTPARLSHDRAANSSDRAEVRASRVESRSETRRARVRRVWGFSRRTTCKKSRVLFGARRARRAARGPTTRAAARNERDPPEWDVRGSSGVEKKRHKRHKRHSGHGG